MRSAVVVSFFSSSNLGDIALSQAISKIVVEGGTAIKKYDFPTVSSFNCSLDDDKSEAYNIINSQLNQTRRVKNMQIIKKITKSLLGKRNVYRILTQLAKIKMRPKWKKFEEDIKKCDVLIIGGGNMIMDTIPTWPEIFNRYCKIAKSLGKDIYILYVGAGPIKYSKSIQLYKDAFNVANKISVRDPLSKKLCENKFGENIKVVETVDPVFSMQIDLFSKRIDILTRTQRSKVRIGICLIGLDCFNSLEDYISYLSVLKGLLKDIIARMHDYEIVLFSSEKSDYTAISDFYDSLDDKENITINTINRVEDIVGLYMNLNFLIGGRMHSLIFAQKCLLPFIGVIWQEKVIGFGEVSDSLDRLYTVASLDKESKYISRKIMDDIYNVKLIKDMNFTNQLLYKKVQMGNFDNQEVI